MSKLILTVFIRAALLRVESRRRRVLLALHVVLQLSLVAIKLQIEKVCVSLELSLILLRGLVGRPELHLLELLSGCLLFTLTHLLLLGLKRLLLAELFKLLGFLVLVILAALERLENVLVVQKSMRELVLEVLVIEEHADALLYQRHLEDLVDVRSLCRVLLQHLADQLVQLQ